MEISAAWMGVLMFFAFDVGIFVMNIILHRWTQEKGAKRARELILEDWKGALGEEIKRDLAKEVKKNGSNASFNVEDIKKDIDNHVTDVVKQALEISDQQLMGFLETFKKDYISTLQKGKSGIAADKRTSKAEAREQMLMAIGLSNPKLAQFIGGMAAKDADMWLMGLQFVNPNVFNPSKKQIEQALLSTPGAVQALKG